MEADHNSQGRRRTDGPVVGQTGARFGGTAGRRSRAVEPPEEDDAVATQHQRGDHVVGQTGARFPSLLSSWRRKLEEQDPEQQDPEQQDHGQPEHEQPAVAATSAQRPAGQQQAGQAGVAQPEIAPPVLEPDGGDEADGTDWDRSKESYDLVRPYFWTGGRTAAQVDLAVETLVSATGHPPEPPARPEHRTILQLCATPHSVAELAALLSIPLGVARVLLGDLAATGSLAVHRTAGAADSAPDVALMQRVLTGLRRL
ncbi:MAG: DUF742 domain-containing protein [Pseudonocardiales bacterium]